jgi:hypothetical protein
MRAIVAAGVAAAAVALAGCSGSGHPAAAASTHRADIASPGASLTPAPLAVPPLITNSKANRALCDRLVRLHVSRASASRFVAWARTASGSQSAQRRAGKLIGDIMTWYDDSYLSPSKPIRAVTAWGKIIADCRSIGVFGPG